MDGLYTWTKGMNHSELIQLSKFKPMKKRV